MLDAGPFWTPLPDWRQARIVAPGLSVTPLGLGQTLISGNVAAGLARLAPGVAAEGPHARERGATYALRLAPDRVLLIGAADGGIAPANGSAWHDDGFAVSDVSEALLGFELQGARVFEALARGAGVDLAAAAPPGGGACGLRLAETPVIAYRFGATGLRLHVERSLAAYVFAWLGTVAEVV